MDFLSSYKDLETSIRNNLGLLSVKEYEDTLTDNDIIDKIRLARNIRNYYSHHSDGEKLVKVNKDMIIFLNDIKTQVDNTQKKVKDIYKSISKAKYIIKNTNLNDLCETILKGLSNKDMISNNIYYIIDDNNYLLGCITIAELLKTTLPLTKSTLNKTKLTSFNKSLLSNITILHKYDTIDNLSGYYLVTDDGTLKGKVLGELIL